MNVSESEKFDRQTNSQPYDFEKIDNSAPENEVIENNNDSQFTKLVGSAAMIVENRMRDAFLTAIDDAVIPRDEMAVKSITGSTGHWTNCEVQNPGRRYFLGNIRKTPLMSASTQADWI